MSKPYDRSRWLSPFVVDGMAFDLAMQITRSRLAGKELAKRRPSLTLRMGADAEHGVEIRPRLESSPTGWVITQLLVVLVTRLNGKTELGAELRDQGLKLRKWWKDEARTDAAVTLTLRALERFGRYPARAIASDATHCGFCGRALIDPVSRDWGIGPECRIDFERAIRTGELMMEGATHE